MSWWKRATKTVKEAQRPATDPSEARAARQSAERELKAAERRTSQVESTARQAAAHGRPDHFAELMEQAFRRSAHD